MADPIVTGAKAEVNKVEASVKTDVAKVELLPKSLWARFLAWLKAKI